MTTKQNQNRDIVDLDNLTKQTINRIKQVEHWTKGNTGELPALHGAHQIARPKRSAHTASVKEKQHRRTAQHVCNELYNNKARTKAAKLELSTFHRYLTKIKNAIRSDIARHNPELPALLQSLADSYPQYSDLIMSIVTDTGKRATKVKASVVNKLIEMNKVDADELSDKISALAKAGKIEHPIIKYLRLTDTQQTRRKKQIAANLKERKSNKQTYNFGFIERVTNECLESDNFNELALGISLATGRRAIEVIYRGKFTEAGKHKIMFSGQAKKGKGVASAPYSIPTLISAEKIVSAVNKLRASGHYQNMLSDLADVPDEAMNGKINLKCARMLNWTAKKTLDPATDVKDSKVQYKNSRVIALQVAILKIMPNKEYAKLDINEFALRYQGHDHYEEFANYQDIAVIDAPEPVAPVAPIKPVGANVAALEAVDDVINAMGKKTLYKLHERVKEWAVRTGAKVEQTPLYKGAKGDKVGGSLALIKTYLTIPEIAEAVEAYNAGKEDA